MDAHVPRFVIQCSVDGKKISLTEYSRRSWSGAAGRQYAENAPADTQGTDAVWHSTYGIAKTTALKPAVQRIGPVPELCLDVGSSNGRHGECLRTFEWPTIVSMDLNFQALPSEQSVQGDASRMPFPSNCFDVVTSGGALMACGGPFGGLKRVVEECGRVAKKWLLFCEAYSADPTVMTFELPGREMPPAVLLPWDHYLPQVLVDWSVKHSSIYDNRQREDGYQMMIILLQKEMT